MDRKWKSGAGVAPPVLDNASDGYAQSGNPGAGTPATKPGPHWYHMVTEEILAVLTAAGITPDKTSVTQLSAAIGLISAGNAPSVGGRITAASAVSVPTSDVSGAGTVYYTPYSHDRIHLYNGSKWAPFQFTELSQALSDSTKSPAAGASNKIYDMLIWDDAGTRRSTRGPAWSSDTARGAGAGTTELELFEGRLVNKYAITNGPAARRGLYVGSVRTDGSTQINDTLLKRHVWNNYNRVSRAMRAVETADSYTYGTSTFRQANANAANQLDYLVGLDEDAIEVSVAAHASSTNATTTVHVAVGLDSTSAFLTGNITPLCYLGPASQVGMAWAELKGAFGLGRHTLVWLEWASSGGATVTWFGDNGTPAVSQSGIHGRVFA